MKLFKEVGSQVATYAEGRSQELLHTMREKFGLDEWQKDFDGLNPERKESIQKYYEQRSKEWYVAERTGDLSHYLFWMAVGIMETQAPEMRRWSEQGQRKLRLKTLTVCAKCMNDEDGGHRYVDEEGYLTQEWIYRRRQIYRG